MDEVCGLENGQRYLYSRFRYDQDLSRFQIGVEVSSDFVNWVPVDVETEIEEIDGVTYQVVRLGDEFLGADVGTIFARIYISD